MDEIALEIKKTGKVKKIVSLPFPVYFWTVFALAIGGLVNSLYLSVSHYRVYTDIGYKSFCALTRTINCDTVSQSPYSIFLDLPVPVWGIIGYSLFLLLLTQKSKNRSHSHGLWSLLFLTACGFSAYSIVLAWISSFLIHSYCIMCIVSYGINFSLLFYCWLVLRRFSAQTFLAELKADLSHLAEQQSRMIFVFGIFLIAALTVWIVFPNYWNSQTPLPPLNFATGITADGHPWIGAEQPEVEIVEFTDYRCFQCRKMNYFLRGLMARYPDKIRIVHRHFPMDHRVNPLVKSPMHVGAGAMTMMAIYAAGHGKFWQMHDQLFSLWDTHEIGTRDLAQSVGLDPVGLARSLRNTQILRKLRDDMTAGYKLGVTGTPTYVI
jgi:uncharacterized membrane protein